MFNLFSLVYRFVHDSSTIEAFFLFASDKCDSISSYPEGLEKKYCFITTLMCSPQLYSSKMCDHSWKIIRYLSLFIFGDNCPGTSVIRVRSMLCNRGLWSSVGQESYSVEKSVLQLILGQWLFLQKGQQPTRGEEQTGNTQWSFSSSHLGNVCTPGKCLCNGEICVQLGNVFTTFPGENSATLCPNFISFTLVSRALLIPQKQILYLQTCTIFKICSTGYGYVWITSGNVRERNTDWREESRAFPNTHFPLSPLFAMRTGAAVLGLSTSVLSWVFSFNEP